MKHNYKITDLRVIDNIWEPEMNLENIRATIRLQNPMELPAILKKRLECIINNLISEEEQKNNILIPLEDMELEICITVDTVKKALLIQVFIVYDVLKEFMHNSEVITATDEHYDVIKKFFFSKLKAILTEQVRKLEDCIQ